MIKVIFLSSQQYNSLTLQHKIRQVLSFYRHNVIKIIHVIFQVSFPKYLFISDQWFINRIKIICIFINFNLFQQQIMRLMTMLFILSCFMLLTRAQDDHQDHQDHQGEDNGSKMSTAQIWGFGILAIVGVSLIGFLAAGIMICFKKIVNQSIFTHIIRFFFTLACGALLGDVLIHILAQAFLTTGAQSWIVALVFVLSVLFALLLEKFFHTFHIAHSHWIKGEEKHDHDHDDGQQHNHDHGNQVHNANQESQLEINNQKVKNKQKIQVDIINSKSNILQTNQTKQKDSKPSEQVEQNDKPAGFLSSWKNKGASGYLNLVGSLIHNFIDGLALGVAFATGQSSEFVPILIAIVAHEIPRELGDVAILLKSNFNQFQTICCNGVVNLISIIGGIIGLAVTNLSELVQMYILVFVAGNFIYIAADIWRHMFKKNCISSVIQFFGFSLGIVIMFLLLLLEPKHDHEHGGR